MLSSIIYRPVCRLQEVVQDFQQSILQCVDDYSEEAISQMPSVPYEFPNGYHQVCVAWQTNDIEVIPTG